MSKIYKIYKCVNIINGKTYVGFTNKLLEKRITEHNSAAKNDSDYLVHKAIRKYGADSFLWECIFESTNKNYMLNEMENYFIQQFNSYFENGLGYNMTFGGQGGMTGKLHTEQTKNKLKLARNRRATEPMAGKTHSVESKQKMSAAKLGKIKGDSYKKVCSERNLKRYSDPGKRKILSDAIKLSWQKRKLESLGV